MEKSLVFVVGAGASAELHFPIGSELTNRIGDVLSGIPRDPSAEAIFNAFLDHCNKKNNDNPENIQRFYRSAKLISQGMPLASSIDSFIDVHKDKPDLELCAKLTISYTILKAEAASQIKWNGKNEKDRLVNFGHKTSNWLLHFFRSIQNCSVADLPFRLSKIAIICFNYDRCIEHYLHTAIKVFYEVDSVRAASILSNLEIYHPYGLVGDLPWKSPNEGIEFGMEIAVDRLIQSCKRIKTFTESLESDNVDLARIREILSVAPRIVFLGFAFHKQNMDLLNPMLSEAAHRLGRVYGTAYGMSKDDVERIREKIYSIFRIEQDRTRLDDVTCADLFLNYRLSLALD